MREKIFLEPELHISLNRTHCGNAFAGLQPFGLEFAVYRNKSIGAHSLLARHPIKFDRKMQEEK